MGQAFRPAAGLPPGAIPMHFDAEFDTSAENWLARSEHAGAREWMRAYLLRHEIHLSAITATERIRGCSLLWRRREQDRKEQIEAARVAYLATRARILPLDAAIAVVAGEILALLPEPPTVPRRSQRLPGSRISSVDLKAWLETRITSALVERSSTGQAD